MDPELWIIFASCVLIIWSAVGFCMFIESGKDEWNKLQLIFAISVAGPVIWMVTLFQLIKSFVFMPFWEFLGKRELLG